MENYKILNYLKLLERRNAKIWKYWKKIEALLQQILKEFGKKTCSFPLSLRFIQKFRRHLGYQPKFAKQKPILSQENKKKRFAFARKNVKQRWKNHVYIDENWFSTALKQTVILGFSQRKIISSKTSSFSKPGGYLWNLNLWASFLSSLSIIL